MFRTSDSEGQEWGLIAKYLQKMAVVPLLLSILLQVQCVEPKMDSCCILPNQNKRPSSLAHPLSQAEWKLCHKRRG